jgi:hypothetical protein
MGQGMGMNTGNMNMQNMNMGGGMQSLNMGGSMMNTNQPVFASMGGGHMGGMGGGMMSGVGQGMGGGVGMMASTSGFGATPLSMFSASTAPSNAASNANIATQGGRMGTNLAEKKEEESKRDSLGLSDLVGGMLTSAKTRT